MALKSQPLVSVVTPVYNTEKYLSECIESVLCQTYENWEYIIVNNCSTDKSLEIAQSYAKKDSRIYVLNNDTFLNHLQNANHALRQISPNSKYCKIVHADDWIFPECLTKMVEIAEANPTVGIVGAYRMDEDSVNLDGLPYYKKVYKGEDICCWHLLDRPYLFGSPSSLLIRSSLIRKRDPFYQENSLQADKEVCFEILKESDFGFVHQVLTYTRRHNDSVTAIAQRLKTWNIERLCTLIKYGPEFFNEDEYQKILNRSIDNYHSFLVRSFIELKDKSFFEYQKNSLKSLGIKINSYSILKPLIKQLFNITDTIRTMRNAKNFRNDSNIKNRLSYRDFFEFENHGK